MSYVILDLEWNGAYSKRHRRYINEIIEFGAVKVNNDFKIIDTFSILIKQEIGKKLTSAVKNLTQITNEELINAPNNFKDGLEKFENFLNNSILLTWGLNDILALIENYRYFYSKQQIPFLNKYCDLQEYAQKRLDLVDPSQQLGLVNCAKMLKIKEEGLELHRAVNDATLSAECFKRLYEEKSFNNSIENANKKTFYKKLFFKPIYIKNINSKHINKKEMYFNCEKCNSKLNQTKKWHSKNRNFVSVFKCNKCKLNYIGRISFKLKYNGVTIKKKLNLKKKKSSEKDSKD